MPDAGESLRIASEAILHATNETVALTAPLIDVEDEETLQAAERIMHAAKEMRRLGLWLRAEADLADKAERV